MGNRGYSLYSVRRVIAGSVGLIVLIAIAGGVIETVGLQVSMSNDETQERLTRGTIHLERLNGLVYNIVMESRGIYMSPDWETAEQYGRNIPPALEKMQQIGEQWKMEATAGQQANVEELGRRIDQFVQFRTELVRLGREESTAAARAFGDNDANRNVRIVLNRSLESLAKSYDRDLAAALREAKASDRLFALLLEMLAASGGAMLLGLLFLIRQVLLAPLYRLRDRIRRLANGDLDSLGGDREHAAEFAEMAQAIEAFRGDLIDRRRLTLENDLLAHLGEWLQSCNTLGELYEMVDIFLAKMLPGAARSLFISQHSHGALQLSHCANGAAAAHEIQPDDCWALRRGRTYTFGESEIGFPCAHVHAAQPNPYCCIPILAHGETIGLLHVEFSREEGGTGEMPRAARIAEERRLAVLCTEQIGLTIANVQLRDRLREQSIRDPLTNLFNRRYLAETGWRELARAARSGQPVGLLSIDIDHFKLYNDAHGHDAGDAVLRAFSDRLRTIFRGEDVPCRSGGEEFVVLLPGASLDVAAQRAERLRGAIEGLVIHYLDRDLPPVTISIGVAACPATGRVLEDLLRAADEAMYQAKANGRNRVELARATEARDDEAPAPAAPFEVPAPVAAVTEVPLVAAADG
jgi:diguanylate cyclase (GGDEF)-like protein